MCNEMGGHVRAILVLLLLTSVARGQTPVAAPSLDTLATAMATAAQCAAPTSTDDGSFEPQPHEAEILINVANGTSVSSSAIMASSGNPKFDQRAASCLRSLTLGAALSQRSTGVFVWVYSKNGAIALQPDRPPQWAIAAPAVTGSPHECSRFYPRAAMGQTGQTLLDLYITTEGAVTNATIEKSSGNLALDQAAIECVSQWRYRPATQNGVPVKAPWKTIVRW
jgi:TonB family protein